MMFLPRHVYDTLVVAHTSWMRDEWPKLARKWTIGGVWVSGDEPLMRQLRDRLQLEW